MGILLRTRHWLIFFLAVTAAARAQTATMDEGLRQTIERATYSLKDSGHGTWRGENATQRLSFEFAEGEARLKHPKGSVAFHLNGYGYGDGLRAPVRAKLAATGNRMEYRRGELTEWYVNGSQGLEQGFTFGQRPGPKSASQPLVIALGIGGELVPAQSKDKNSVQFESAKNVVLRYGGLKAVDAHGRIVPSRMEVRDREIRLIVDDRDVEYPLVVDPAWTQVTELAAPDGIAGDTFGESVAVSGNTAVVGAPHAANNRGAVYVFVNHGAGWVLQQELTASNGKGNDQFGYSVALSGDVALIGANNGTQNTGAAYVFLRTAGVWTQQQELSASDAQTGDKFGSSVALNGATALIGAPAKTVGSNQLQGAAYVFTASGGTWSQSAELTASDGAAGDRFGSAMSANGNIALIGAPYRNVQQGAAYIFSVSGMSWTQVQDFAAWDGLPSDYFGSSVSVSGNLGIVGSQRSAAPGFAYLGTSIAGVFSQWVELTASDGVTGDIFGASVAVSGNTAVVGAPFKNSGQGAVYTFVNGAGSGSQQQELTTSDGLAGDRFGSSVSVSGSAIVAGASYKNSQQGAAYVFAGASLGMSSLLFGSSTGTSSVELSSTGSWTATANDSFLHISPASASGTGNALIVFTYDAFAGAQSRTGTLTIAGLTLAVTQAGPECLGPSGSIALLSSGLNNVGGLAVDFAGNVYIADTGAGTIMQWNAATQQSATIVSSGLTAPAGLAVDGAGNIYIADTGNNAIEEWNATSQQLAPVLSSGLSSPSSVAVDTAGNVYIADAGNNAIKEWSPSTQHVTTLVSTGLSGPSGVAVDLLGNVYFSDSGNNAIKEWVSATHAVTTLASAALGQPSGVAVDGSGNVYFTTPLGVQEWSAANQQVVALGLVGGPGLAVDGSGNVYLASANRIVEQSNSFVGPATQSPALGATAPAFVIPATSLSGVFSPTIQSNNPFPHWVSIAGTYNQDISRSVIGLFIGVSWSYKTQPATLSVLGRTIIVNQPASLLPVITLSHQGSFVQGQQGAQYTITLSTPAGGLSYAPPYIGVVDNLPPGLTLVSIVPTGGNPYNAWKCSGFNCSNGFFANAPVLPATFTVTVNVAQDAPSVVTNEATVSAVDGSATASDPTTIVAGGPLAILTTSATLARATVGAAYSAALAIAGGNPATLQWAVSSGALPPGLTLNASTGMIAGTPGSTSGSPYSFGITVTDTASGHASQERSLAIQVAPGSQTINFGMLSNAALGTGPFTVGAVSTSGLPVIFSSQTMGVCTVSGTRVTLVAVGTCTVQATQSGNTNWAAATPENRSLQVTALACGLRQNGNISVTDVQLMITQASGISPPINDLTGDGAINIADVQIQINAALGLGCTTN